MKTYESEYDLLQNRRGNPYSEPHQAMYLGPIALLYHGKRATILDIGCGIGFGLEKMLEAEIVDHYIGLDPDPKCIEYLAPLYALHPYIEIVQVAWPLYPAVRVDFTFCIEVLEHVEEPGAFLDAARAVTGEAMFLSTPNSQTSKHGVWEPKALVELLEECGFKAQYVEWQWTTFYLCTP